MIDVTSEDRGKADGASPPATDAARMDGEQQQQLGAGNEHAMRMQLEKHGAFRVLAFY